MIYLLKTFILISVFICNSTILSSAISNSLIKTSNGFVETKHINIGNTLLHTLSVSEQKLLIHNAVPVIVIGLAWLFGEGLKFAGITLGTVITGSYIGVKLYNKHKQASDSFDISLQIGTYGGYNPDPDDDDENNERKFNTITKTEFFKMVEKDYERWRDNIYKRKPRAKGVEDAEYVEWDYKHNDVEAYGKNRWHMGSINPRTLKIYKPSVPGRKIPK